MSAKLQYLVREPTLHFLLIAVLAFVGYGLFNADDGKVLEIEMRELEARLFMQELASGQELTTEQRQLLTDAYIEEQILVQEALAMNLDNDARIHDILAQKMRHVLSGNVIQPDDGDLETYYRENIDRYRIPERLDLDELVFNSRDELPESVLTLLQQGAGAEQLLELHAGDVTPLNEATHLDLASIFSEDFADQVFAAETGQWQGPFNSNRGQHWLRIRQRQAASVPELQAIAERVRLDWIATEEEALLAQEIARLRQQYRVSVNSGASE